jgi:hypothetical protein
MNGDRVRELRVSVTEIPPKTRWIFVEMTTEAVPSRAGTGGCLFRIDQTLWDIAAQRCSVPAFGGAD